MTFSNEFPKQEVTVITNKKIGSLISDDVCTVHFRDYKGYLDTVQHITLTGDRNAWFGIKSIFKYDVMMCNVKDTYTDEFGRIMKVKVLN